TLGERSDPAVLAEIMAVRNRRKSELAAFRTRMDEEAEKLLGAELSPDTLMDRIAIFDHQIRPVIAETAQAMDDKWRVPKLVLRKSGATVVVGLLVALGAA